MAERGGGPCPQAVRSRGAPEGVFHVGCVRILWRCAARGRVRNVLWAVDHGVGGVDGEHLAERGGGPCPQAERGQGPCPQHAMGGRSRRGPCRRPACAAERPRSGILPRVASAAFGRLSAA